MKDDIMEEIMKSPHKPLITAIIPTYRRPKLLRRAILSVLNQAYPYLQVCIYDNASDDETASVVAELAKKDPRVKYHCHKKNVGSILNFQYGLKHIKTPFFSVFSDDDVLLPNFYEIAMKGFEKHPDAMFSACSTISMKDDGKVLCVGLSSWKREGYYTPPEGFFESAKSFPHWTSIVFRTDVLKKVGSINLDAGPAIDFDFELRIASRFPFVISKEPCGIFVSHESSSCMLSDSNSIYPYHFNIIRNLREDKRIPLNIRIDAEKVLNEDFKRKLSSMWVYSIKRKNFEDARRIVDILRKHYKGDTRQIIIRVATPLFEHLPITYYALYGITKIRKYFERNEAEMLQRQFGKYSEFLKI